MRMPRRRFLIVFVALFLVWTIFQLHIYYHVLGFFRGDAYFGGKPTCYWNAQAVDLVPSPPPTGFLKHLYSWFPSLVARGENVVNVEVFASDPRAVPVLLEMALDISNDPIVRERACQALCGPLSGNHVEDAPQDTERLVAFFSTSQKQLETHSLELLVTTKTFAVLRERFPEDTRGLLDDLIERYKYKFYHDEWRDRAQFNREARRIVQRYQNPNEGDHAPLP